VDASGYYIGPGGMHIAGLFATVGSTKILTDWDPGAQGSQMISTGDGKYTIKVTFAATAAGQNLQFLFVRNNIWYDYQDYSEGNPGETFLNSSCAVDDVCCGGFNRIITIPSYNATFNANFDHCGKLVKASLLREDETGIASDLSIYPNPATDQITLAGLDEDAFVQIANLVGQITWSGNVSAADPKINVSQLPAGSYFLSANGGNTTRFNIVK
jgi:hypothetical protein